MKSNPKPASSRGFTLIEVIVSLILVGIMSAVAGMGIVSATKAFIFTKEAAEISQKSQLAMNRLTKSIANWTSVTTSPAPSSNTLTLTRNDTITGGTVTETYSYSGNTLSLTVGSATDVLCAGLTNFNLEYLRSDMGGDSFWSTGQSVSDLNMVRVTMTQAGQSGTNSSTFASRAVPVNTARGDIQALQAKYSSGGSCFVATAAYGDHDDPAVVLLRQFRDRVLSQNDTGKQFIAWYYREGPALAGFISNHPAARWPARVLLAPVVGMVFLMLYFPSGLILIPAMTLLLLRLGYAFFTKGPRGRMIKPLSMRGSVLIGLIITMVIMSALGAAMVPIFSASNLGNVASMFQPRANYLAESGFSYAVKEYLRDESEANIIANHNRAFTLANGDSFKTFIYPYWFRNPSAKSAGTASLAVNSVATVNNMDSFPSKFSDAESFSGNRYIRVGTETTPRSYTSTTYNSTTHTLTFNGLSPTTAIAASQVVYPAAQTIASAQTILPEGMSSSSQIFRISNSANSTVLADFPQNRGVISFSVSGTTYTIAYDAVVSDGTGAYFIGLHNVPSPTMNPIEASGRNVPASTMVYLGKHAEIKSKGIAGTEGGGFTAERMLHYDQSLVKVDTWKKTTLEMKGAALAAGKTDIVGTSALDTSTDGGGAGGALKVTGTVDAVSFMEEGVKGSLVREYVAGIAVPQLQQIWANSGNTLSYDLQIKMRFSAGDENTTGASTKTPGSYMPGLAFRLTGTTTTTLKYYGLSVMRGIQGATGSTPARDRDGISDYLFKAWVPNSGALAPTTAQLACIRQTNADFQWTTWSSTPPQDGRPYVILWQRDVTLNEEGGWSSSWSQQEAQMDWLAYKETCTEATTTLYRYGPTGSTAPPSGYAAGWYDGVIPSTVAPTGTNVLTAIRLVDQSNILATTVKEGVTLLGAQAADYVWVSASSADNHVGTVRDPLNGLPVAPRSVTTTAGRTYANRPVAYIFPGTGETGANTHDFLMNNNYRIYPKEWITIMVQLFEIKGDFDCDGAQDDKVNVLQVYYGDPDGLAPPSGQTYGDSKSIYRRAEPRGTIHWPEDGNYLTTTVWNEKALAANTSNFTSKVADVTSSWGWGTYSKKFVDRAQDSTDYINPDQKDWPTVYTDWYKSPSSGTLSQFELGLHAMGIDAPNDRAFFDDFALHMYEKTATGLLPGLRSE
ncbi:MAG: prepilin-type N-terminal cleavage/methylation domain-containing protein [Deltaproteobacteria bacterium]|nr:prepilin-type N-terminal cleavage/methylation domain-containing protein [Deltaproteobacteria bacterium]